MTAYRRGVYFERRVRLDMESRGWWVIRAAGSHGPADLVALKVGEPPLLIQVKANALPHKKEGIALAALAASVGAEGLLAKREGRKLVYRTADSGEAKAMLEAALKRDSGQREGGVRQWLEG